MAVPVTFVEGQEEDGVFQAHRLVVTAYFGERGGSLLYSAGAAMQSKPCVLHTQISLPALLRGKELWTPCVSP